MNENATPKTLRDLALDSMPANLREPLLTLASQHHISAPDDPFWTIASATANAMAAAQAAGEAAMTVQTAVQEIPGAIYEGASKAAADVRATMETAIAATVNTSVATAAQAGANALRQAAKDLPAVARQEQDRIVQEWKGVLTDAARKHVFAGFFQQFSGSVTLAVVLVGAIFIGGLISGGAGMRYVMTAQHRLTPPGWHLLVDQQGAPLCGPLAGHDVCLANKAPRP